MNFISYRRFFIDQKWTETLPQIEFPLVDLGGVKNNRRGQFQIPEHLKKDWQTLNSNPVSQPDYLEMLPRTSLPSSYYATVVVTEVLEYVEDYQGTIAEIHRILKPNGLLVLSVPFLSPQHGDKEHDKLRFTETYLKSLLGVSFNITEFSRLGSFLSVAMDGWRSNTYSASESSLYQKFMMKLFKVSAKAIIGLEKYLFPNNEMANTGYWILARKR